MMPAISCPSCGTPRQGRFCAACGERFLDHHDLELKHFLLHDLPHELLHLDSKLGATVRALVLHPGAMPADHVSGRRQPYLDPVRLYVVVYVVFLFLTSLGALDLTLRDEVVRFDQTGLIARLMAHRPQVDWHDPAIHERLESTRHWLSELGTLAIVFLLAAAQALIFRAYHRRYLEHLALSLSVATFAVGLDSLLAILIWALKAAHVHASTDWMFNALNGVVLPIYWYAAIRRFYGIAVLPAIGYAAAVMLVDVLIAMTLNQLVLAALIVTA